MENIAADPITERIIDTYFSGLSLEDRDDVFHFVRNFIVEQQTNHKIHVPEIPLDPIVSDSCESNESGDADDEDETEYDDTVLNEICADVDVRENGEIHDNDVNDVSPYTSHTVDSIEVFLHVRAIHGQYLCGRPFVGFHTFYVDIFAKT